MAKPQWFSGRHSIVPTAALVDPGLKTRTKLVLVALASFVDGAGRTGPLGKAEIAAVAGLSPTNLARELRELSEAGWLEVQHQPGAKSIYQLKVPDPVVPGQTATTSPIAPATPPERLTEAPIFTERGTVASVTAHGSGWLVGFSLADGSHVATIFPECPQPCIPGDIAQLQVREWRDRKNIAGGAASGVTWIDHHPAPPPPSALSFDLVVTDLQRYATPAGLVFVSFSARNPEIAAEAMLATEWVPADLADGDRIRVTRRDGSPITAQPGRMPAHLELVGDVYRIEHLENLELAS